MKKVVCFALVFTILINVLGFGFLNVRASAIAPFLVALGEAAINVIKGVLIGGVASVTAETVTAIDEGQKNKVLQDSQSLLQDATDGNLVSVNYNEDTQKFYFTVSPNVSADNSEFAQRLVSKLGEYDFPYVDTGMGAESNSRIPAMMYQKIKNDVTNEYLEYIYTNSIVDGYNLLGESAVDELPDYDFDFTGPVLSPNIVIPTSTGFKSNTIGDFSLSRAFTCTRGDGYFSSAEAATAAGATYMKNWGTNSDPKFMCAVDIYSCGQGLYAIYNGKIYYNCKRNPSSAYQDSITLGFIDSDLSNFCSSDGENLSQAGCTSFVGLPCGYYVCNNPKAASNIPAGAIEEDITEPIGGGEINVPVREDENIIAQYIQNVGDPDSLLDIAPDGSITGADGITIDQIRALLDDLANQLNTDIDLSSLEEYLQAIEKACRNTLTGEQLNQALKGIKSKIKDYSGDLGAILSAINGVKDLDQTQVDKLTSIEEQTRAIAEALEAAKELEFELEKDDIEVDYFSVEHTGLAEAKAFVDNYDVVDQLQRFMLNILDPDVYGDGAPNFKFYYDSNGDGKKEIYNALDLSFLEQPLSNENIADKRRFSGNSMTVREFIQLLMVLICYVAFAVKVLRKLPGLVTGGESAAGDGLEIKSIDRANELKSIGKGG